MHMKDKQEGAACNKKPVIGVAGEGTY